MTSSVPRTPRPRLFYLDFIRALAAILIIITHYNNPYMSSRPVFMYEPFGVYVGGLGVSLFLIISGAALMYTYGDMEKLNLRLFYKKRFLSIFPMFWIAFVIANAYLFLCNNGHIVTHAPAWSIIFSILGIDGLIANTTIPTFYTLGEWFLGFILLFYIIFPIMRYGIKKYPKFSASIIAFLFIGTILLRPNIIGLPVDILITTRLPELAFGMYFIQYIKKVRFLPLCFSIILLSAQEFSSFLPNFLAVPAVGVASFLVLTWVAEHINCKMIQKPFQSIAKYSYPIFLVHHVVISQVFNEIAPSQLSQSGTYLLFFIDCLLIAFFSILLLNIERKVLSYCHSLVLSE